MAVHVFKTAHHPRFTTDCQELAVDVAMATAAAPTYLPAHVTARGLGLVDGGLWANNPAGLAVAEGIGTLGWAASDIRVLSVGCLDDALEIPHPDRRSADRLAALGLLHVRAIRRVTRPGDGS